MSDRRVSASTVVAAPPAAVFAMIADPRRHGEFDGSGTVRDAVSGPATLSLGAEFGMKMQLGPLHYRIGSTVVEFEPDRLIGWQHFGRHVWRYELDAVDGGTRVTETFDYGPARAPRFLELLGYPERNAAGIRATLARLTEIFGAPVQA